MVLLLSPHYDDIAFSMGGVLAQAVLDRKDALLVTFFTRSKHAPYDPSHEHAERVSALRRRENVWFAIRARLRTRDYDLREGLLENYNSMDDLFDGRDIALDPRTPELRIRVEELAKEYCPDLVFVPLSLGHHVEHRMLRSVAEDIFSARVLVYYEDLPYAGQSTTKVSASPEVALHHPRLNPCRIVLRDWAAKMAFVECYASQVAEEEREAIALHAFRKRNAAPVETLWSNGFDKGSVLKRIFQDPDEAP